MRYSLAILLSVQVLARPAAGQSEEGTGRAIRDFGLVGRWSEDCARIPTMQGFEVPQLGDTSFYVVKTSGEEVIFRTIIVRAESVSSDTLVYQYTDPMKNIYSVTLKKESGGGIRFFAMIDQRGRKSVENGVSIGTGRAEEVMRRCR